MGKMGSSSAVSSGISRSSAVWQRTGMPVLSEISLASSAPRSTSSAVVSPQRWVLLTMPPQVRPVTSSMQRRYEMASSAFRTSGRLALETKSSW